MINNEYIENLLNEAKNPTKEDIKNILENARNLKGLTHLEVAKLLMNEDESRSKEMYSIAGQIKNKIYGKRIVMFAPLYISNFCVNNCTYCGYQRDNKFERRKLTYEQIKEEVRLLEKMGHKRLALEVGEDPKNCPIEYVIKAIETIYETQNDVSGEIRRVNVNVAATTVEDYKKLKTAGIGTYILFQETYHKPSFEYHHPKSLKGDYNYHLEAFDRAMEAGIDDVGAGVLFGLYDYKFEVLSLMLHNEHLENKFGCGFHTISVPRLKKAQGMDLSLYPHIPTDDEFRKIVAIIRLAVPYTGIILSTREGEKLRKELLTYGVSQMSAGSITGVGGYKDQEEGINVDQFITEDHRSPLQVVKDLLKDGYIPSYCTACYRTGRTGDRFMRLAKSGQIGNICNPNALMTLLEFSQDYGDEELLILAKDVIENELNSIPREDVRILTQGKLVQIENGQRDLFI
jgi:2-iminoacetate synthase